MNRRIRTQAVVARAAQIEMLEARRLLSLSPVGAEFHVNTFTTNAQNATAIASDADGDFVVVWAGQGTTDTSGTFGQRYNAAGVAQGGEFRVNTFTTGSQRNPVVAMDSDGDFVAAWESPGQDGSGYGIYAQRYNAAGAAQGIEFRVNTTTSNSQTLATVAMSDAGQFVVAWASDGDVFAQRYNAAGAAQGGEFRANTFTTGSQIFASAAMDADGDFILTWNSGGQDGDANGIYAQRYNSAGIAQGIEFRVNTFTTGNQSFSSVSMDASGNFAVAWASAGQDGSGYGAYAQRYNATGAAQGAEFRVNTTTGGAQSGVALSMDAEGDFLVVFNNTDGNGDGVFAQSFEASGVDVGGEFRINTFTTGAQAFASVALDDDGDAIVAWQSTGQDGSLDGVYAQRLDEIPPPPPETEFRVNTFTTNSQGAPATAADDDGNFVVVWSSTNQDGSGSGIYAQRYSAQGSLRELEFRVNTTTTNSQTRPAVAMDSDGDFVITWDGFGSGDSDGIFGQRFNAAGVPQGSEFQVNTSTTDFRVFSAVAMDAVGNFVVTWQVANDGVFAQRFNSDGIPQGSEFAPNTFSASQQVSPAVAMEPDGDFLLTWNSYTQDGDLGSIIARRYSAAGVAQGAEFRVNSTTAGRQSSPTVAIDADGDSVVAWKSRTGPGETFYGIFAQRYGAAGEARGGEFRVNSFTSEIQEAPRAVVGADGDFVIVWESNTQDGNLDGVFAQRFNAAGAAQGTEFRVNTFTTGSQASPAVAISSDRELIVAWQSPQDPDASSGVYAKRYVLPAPAPVVLRSSFVPDPAPNRLRFSFSQDVSASLDSADVVLQDLATMQTIPAGELSTSFDVPTSTATITYTGAAGGSTGVLPAGEYRLTLAAAGITNSIGTPMSSNHEFTFSVPVVIPLGGDLRVNTTIPGTQSEAAIARDVDGNFVVVWNSFAQDGDLDGVYGQRFDVLGAKLGIEFRVNTFTTSRQRLPSVAMDATGNFVVAWQSVQDGSGYGIYAQRYNAAGVPQGPEFRVNTFTTSNQSSPSVAMDGDGDFVIAWHGVGILDSIGVFAQRYNAAGTPQGGEFLVNAFTTNSQAFPSAAMDDGGDFVIVWQSFDQEGAGSGYGVYGRRFNASGIPQGSEFGVNSFTTGRQSDVSVAMDNGGDFVVAWEGAGQDASGYGIYAQRYDAAGAPQGAEFRANTTVDDSQTDAAVAMNPAGGFLIAWQGRGGGGIGIIARRFSASGVAIGDEQLVNSLTSRFIRDAAAALNPDGTFVVTFSNGQDPDDSNGVYARRFGTPAPAPQVTGSLFLFATSVHRLQYTFSRNVAASLSTADLVLENLTTAQPIPSFDVALGYNAATNTATFIYTGSGGGITGVLPDGNYRATLLAAGITNTDGIPLAANHVFTFFFLNGDANHDGRINLQDFNILAANFGQQPRDFTQGDFTYDTIVNLADFNILASRFGAVLAAPSVAVAREPQGNTSWSALTRSADQRASRDMLQELLA